MDAKEQANLLRWDGSRSGFYEVYFLKLNDARSRTAVWLRYTLTSPGSGGEAPRAELWGIFFDAADRRRHFALKRTFAIEQLRFDNNRFALELGPAGLSQGACHGELEDQRRGHRLRWELRFDSAAPPLFHLPHPRLYSAPLPKTKLVSPHVDACFDGWVEADGRRLEIAAAPGQQTHMWGTRHGLRWCWGHCSAFAEDPTAVWEGLDAQVAVGPLSSPPLKVFFLRHQGRWHRFNRLRQWLTNRSQWEVGRWTFEARSDALRMIGTVDCALEDLIGVTYTDTDGSPLWCNNTKIADIRIELSDPTGAELGRLTGRGTSALEFVDRRIVPEVPIWI